MICWTLMRSKWRFCFKLASSCGSRAVDINVATLAVVQSLAGWSDSLLLHSDAAASSSALDDDSVEEEPGPTSRILLACSAKEKKVHISTKRSSLLRFFNWRKRVTNLLCISLICVIDNHKGEWRTGEVARTPKYHWKVHPYIVTIYLGRLKRSNNRHKTSMGRSRMSFLPFLHSKLGWG